ncbi:digeranylgeranylglycerophospholipid reductase [Hyperthermus butylicus]|uniref:Dehydrogenase n=1 Tax=Hyperthermus butylicus (strain DSM 5456 / JCM 9403 / PLM1-5) TaxID=415426 RepID=A2BM78_HYPBU|nr:digeranylgeranylglycerophospholipid reductase [Hyperthermus butylicus]ABM81089.1 putative Dehydrogenase [Hyperthermus butylicus DSM 5456]
MKNEPRYDVIVAGLGPAGSVALWHLARMGFRVLGIERNRPEKLWSKPCGDALGAHHITESHLPEPPSSVLKNRVTAIDIYSPSEEVRYRVHGKGYIIDRTAFGRWLVEDALNRGAEVLYETSILEPIISGGKVIGVKAKSKDGRVVELYASLVIEATGFSRVIRRRLPRDWPIYEDIDPRDTNIAYREIIEYEDYEIEEPNVIRIYLNQEIAPGGYWWFFPETSHRSNVGLGVQGGMGYPSPMQIYREKLVEHSLLRLKHRVITAAGAPLPTRRPSNTMVGPGVVVIGDAGYTVNPIHGGGMGYGFRAAYYAAKAFEEAYNKGRFDEEALWSLNTSYMRSIGAKQASLDVFRRFLQRLGNDDIEFGMKHKLIPETDVLYASETGELKLSVIEKAMIVLRGLRRPTLLAKLKTVADYMKKIKELYMRYPENPSGLKQWVREVENLLKEYEARLGS